MASAVRSAQARFAALIVTLGLAVLVSDAADWRPVSLLLALAVLMLLADTVTVPARRLRASVGSVPFVAIMALLGPAPAVAIGASVCAFEQWLHRRPPSSMLSNVVTHAVVALVGGLAFESLRAITGLDRGDPAYAALVAPVYVLLMALMVALVVMLHPYPGGERLPMFRESGLPMLPWELVNAMMTALVVFVWPEAGLAAVAGVLVVMLVSLALLQSLAGGLASRDRLFAELLLAERRERGRLAEALHDGPVQRLAALRLRLAGTNAELARELEAAIDETRAIVTSLHPAAISGLGFEACVRAAAAPFQTTGRFQLTVHSEVDVPESMNAVLLPVAQELVVNAAKHARPGTIAVTVAVRNGRIELEVRDDGVGIGEPSKQADAGHIGLAVVRRRVSDAGGSFEIAARAGGGTRSRATLPIDGSPHHRSEAAGDHRQSPRSTAGDVHLPSASSS
jgi:signal transduction histidine kinase